MPPKVTKNMEAGQEDRISMAAAGNTASALSNDVAAISNALGQEIAKLNDNESFQLACAVLCLDGFPNKMKVDMQKFADLAGYKGPSVSSTIITRLKRTLHSFQADLLSGKTIAPHKAGNRMRSGTALLGRPAKRRKTESNAANNSSDDASIVNNPLPEKDKTSGAKRSPKKRRAQTKAKKEIMPSSSEDNAPEVKSKRRKAPAPNKVVKVKSEDDDASTCEDENFTIANDGSSNEANQGKQPNSTTTLKEESSD